jgi:hypothetical protein
MEFAAINPTAPADLIKTTLRMIYITEKRSNISFDLLSWFSFATA